MRADNAPGFLAGVEKQLPLLVPFTPRVKSVPHAERKEYIEVIERLLSSIFIRNYNKEIG